jgi:hypothetical protein
MGKDAKLPRFSGELNEPIVEPMTILNGVVARVIWGADLERERARQHADWTRRVLERQADKLHLLLKHYNIGAQDSDRWLRLSWLAYNFVPGMRPLTYPPKKRGRPPDLLSKFALVNAVDALNGERGKGVADAIRHLRRINRKVWGRHTAESLSTRYYEGVRLRKKRARTVRTLAKQEVDP